ncbi:MAG: PhnB protein [Akkermansiaceae bacterium]|jgi:PhnB protein
MFSFRSIQLNEVMKKNEPTLTLSLTVNDGNAALEFYTQAFGAKELYRMPMPDGSVAHAEMMIGNTKVYLSEGCPEWHCAPMPEGVQASCLFGLNIESCDDSFAQAVSAGGVPLTEPADQPWGSRSAMIRDPYGYRWSLSQFIEEVSPEEMCRRMKALTEA